MKRNLTLPEAAAYLNCSTRTIYRLLTTGEIIAFKLRGSLRITAEGLDGYVQRQILKFQIENGVGENFVTKHDRP